MNVIKMFVACLIVMTTLGLVKIPEDAKISIKDVLTFEDRTIEAGSITYADGNTDGILRIEGIFDAFLDTFVLFDDGCYESFEYMGITERNDILVVCREYEYTEDFSLLVYRRIVIIRYDIDGNETGKIYISGNYHSFHNHNGYLVLTDAQLPTIYIDCELDINDSVTITSEYLYQYSDRFRGSAYVDGIEVTYLDIDTPGNHDILISDGNYRFSYRITVFPEITINGEKFNDDFIGEVNVVSKGSLFLDGCPYVSGSAIGVAGYHVITVMGVNDFAFSEEFLILPTITYMEDGIIQPFFDSLDMLTPISIYSDGISMMLDNEAYHSETITSVGTHELTIYGMNNYLLILNFRILPSVSGIEDGGSYQSVSIDLFGMAYLNGKVVQGSFTIDTPGEYLLELYCDGEPYSEYSFSILETDTGNWLEGLFSNYLNYVLFAVIGIGSYLIFRKK